jgi:hypothetical protein
VNMFDVSSLAPGLYAVSVASALHHVRLAHSEWTVGTIVLPVVIALVFFGLFTAAYVWMRRPKFGERAGS